MRSIADVERFLPKEALEELKAQFSPAVYNRLLVAFRSERVTSFRVNTLKAEKSVVLQRLRKDGFKCTQVTAVPNGFYCDTNCDKQLLKHELAVSGHIYLQSISSMLPAEILHPSVNSYVLDIAAAPGSKTTHLAAIMGNSGNIDAIEPDFIRMERLKHNCSLLGVENTTMYHTTGQKWTGVLYNQYDYILADVPCSGEGRFSIHDKASYIGWKKNEINRFATLQKKLLAGAIQALKPGGTLLYSTCTLNCTENEEVVDATIREYGMMSILPISRDFYTGKNTIAPFTTFNGAHYSQELSKSMRVLPSETTEGFFICLMKKDE